MPVLHPRQRFAHNLRQARLKKGISQAELAARCDLHRTGFLASHPPGL